MKISLYNDIHDLIIHVGRACGFDLWLWFCILEVANYGNIDELIMSAKLYVLVIGQVVVTLNTAP